MVNIIIELGQCTVHQGRIQDLIRGGAPDGDRPKTAILGPQFCRILVLGPHFLWSGGGAGPPGPPGSAPGTSNAAAPLLVEAAWGMDEQLKGRVTYHIIVPKF